MNMKDAMKAAMKASGHTQTLIAEKMGLTQSAVQQRVCGNPKAQSFIEVANVMGYKVMLVPKAKKVDGAFEVEGV